MHQSFKYIFFQCFCSTHEFKYQISNYSLAIFFISYYYNGYHMDVHTHTHTHTHIHTQILMLPLELFYIKTHFIMISSINLLMTWACSDGGPGLNWGEHNGGRSTFGTENKTYSSTITFTEWASTHYSWIICMLFLGFFCREGVEESMCYNI